MPSAQSNCMLMVSATRAGRDAPSTSIVFSEVMRTPPATGSTDLIFWRRRMRAGRHLAGKAHAIGPVIEAARTVLDAVQRLAEARHQRQCQIAVGDRLAPWHVALGALDIHMDPLVVAGRVGEFVDQRLI